MSQIKALDMTKYLTSEKEYVPWITALSSLSYIGELLLTLPGYEYYEVNTFNFIYYTPAQLSASKFKPTADFCFQIIYICDEVFLL